MLGEEAWGAVSFLVHPKSVPWGQDQGSVQIIKFFPLPPWLTMSSWIDGVLLRWLSFWHIFPS